MARRFYAYDEISMTEDGKYYGSLKYPYYDAESNCISYFAESKQELYDAQKYFKKAKTYEEWENGGLN